jgi:uncharacterized protein DUF5989
MKAANGFTSRMRIIGELLRFLWVKKLWWLIPIIIILILFGLLLFLPGGSAIAPFIYPFF